MSPFIDFQDVSKAYLTEAGDFWALKKINLQVESGEFVAVIGKSGSGKSTLINMLTGIDKPTIGQINIQESRIDNLSEGEMSLWRGKHLGIVFQFFQLLPTLTVLENILLPMDFANYLSVRQREKRALELLEMVEIAKVHAHKLPSQMSGGQQQRIAIARALANNPGIIAADEPTGNLDSKTAELIFELFAKLVQEGKTIMMVTHDRDLAKRVQRTLVISDGEIIEEYLSRVFPGLSDKQLASLTASLKTRKFPAGELILKKGEPVNALHIVTKGAVEIVIDPPNGRQFVVARFEKGQYFGEIELMKGVRGSLATARATTDQNAEIAILGRRRFEQLLEESALVKKNVDRTASVRFKEHRQKNR